MGTKSKIFVGPGLELFVLRANLPSSIYHLSVDRHSSASEIPLPEELY